MKKKIYKFVSVTVIAVAMVVSFQMSKANNATTIALNDITTMALAGDEGLLQILCDPIWVVTVTGTVGVGLGLEVSCTSNGSLKCPLCIWE